MTEAEKERAAVVVWLREQADFCREEQKDHHPSSADWLYLREQVETFHVAADAIENAEHLKDQADG